MIPDHCKITYTKTVIFWKILPDTITKDSYWDGKKWHNLHPGEKDTEQTVHNTYQEI